jgi:hypothetical protein
MQNADNAALTIQTEVLQKKVLDFTAPDSMAEVESVVSMFLADFSKTSAEGFEGPVFGRFESWKDIGRRF